MNKYNEAMNKIEVTADMKSRILANLAKELEAEANAPAEAEAEVPVQAEATPGEVEMAAAEVADIQDDSRDGNVVDIDAGPVFRDVEEDSEKRASERAADSAWEAASKKRNKIAAFRRFGAMAATFAVLFIGVAAVMRMQGGKLSSTAPMYDSAPAATEAPAYEAEAEYAAEATEAPMYDEAAVESAAEAPAYEAEAEYAAEATEAPMYEEAAVESAAEAPATEGTAAEAQADSMDTFAAKAKEDSALATDNSVQVSGSAPETAEDSLSLYSAGTAEKADDAIEPNAAAEPNVVAPITESATAEPAPAASATKIVQLIVVSILMLALFAGAIVGLALLIKYIVKKIKNKE